MATAAAAGAEGRHAVFFPFPAQGHVKAALGLAQLLHRCHGFQVTFVHTEHNRRRLLRSRGLGALDGVPGFRFAAVPDSLPPSEADASQDMGALLSTMEALVPHFRSLASSLLPPASCVISDVEHVLYGSREMGISCVTFWTTSAFAFMASQQLQRLVDMGIVPLKGGSEKDCRLLQLMEDPLQRKSKRARGGDHCGYLGGCKKTTAAALARARLKRNELWLQYSLQKMGGWMDMEESLILEG